MDYNKTVKEKDAETVISMGENIKNLIEVLKFYADERTYNYKIVDGKIFAGIYRDKGRKARELLEKIDVEN